MERIVTVAGIVITLVLFLIWVRQRESYYSRIQFEPLYRRYSGVNGDNLKKYTIKSILGVDIGNDPSIGLSNVNLLVDTLNSGGFTFTHFSDINELNTMFATAYTSGESGLGNRDRMILRAFAWPAVEITEGFIRVIPLNYTSDGVPDFTETIVSESGKTTKEMLQYCFMILDKMLTSGGENPFTPEVIDYINSTIPSKYTQKFDRTDNMSVFNAVQSSQPNETETWFVKALVIGPAYIARIAENKWKLDLSWTP
jgi:hypothetical protein